MNIVPGKEAEYAEYVRMNSEDGYSKGVVDYGESWAALMEGHMACGATLEDIAKQTSLHAEPRGITGFMYGCAVQALARFWVHGEALRVWHNKDWGVEESESKGGVVNPAIFTVGT